MAIDLSVIIPTFRRPVELAEALDSVLNQPNVHVEVIIVDDSPEGSARDVVTGMGDARIHYHRSVNSSGGRPALVRNQGYQHASGRFVHFLDDDDVVAASAYKAMIDALDANPGRGVVFGGIEPFGNDPVELQIQRDYFANAMRRANTSNRFARRLLMTANLLFMDTLLVNSACMIRREFIEPLGGYDAECELNEDTDFYLRAIRRFGSVYLDRLVIHYRTGASSLMHDRNGNESLIRSYRHIQRKYRLEHGSIEFISLKVLARTLLKRI
jgi:glycosyltransferase involved in cell wall biosynthesis